MSVDIAQYKGNPPRGPIPAEYVVSTLNTRTDRNGEVTVIVHDPPPTYISVHSFDLWYSGSLISLGEVLKSGVVLDYSNKGAPEGYWVNSQGQPSMKSGSLLNHDDKARPANEKVAPSPGVIVYVEKKITKSERMRMELP